MKMINDLFFLSLITILLFIGCDRGKKDNNSTVHDTLLLSKPATSAKAVLDSSYRIAQQPNLKDSAATRPTANFLLVPGVAAGSTFINSDADSVLQRLGKPDAGDAAMMKSVSIWYSNHNPAGHSTAIYTQRNTDSPSISRVLLIRVTSPSFRTINNIGPASSLQMIKAAYTGLHKTESYHAAGKTFTVYDSAVGIAFELGTDSTCKAVVIHEKGKPFTGSYLLFRTAD